MYWKSPLSSEYRSSLLSQVILILKWGHRGSEVWSDLLKISRLHRGRIQVFNLHVQTPHTKSEKNECPEPAWKGEESERAAWRWLWKGVAMDEPWASTMAVLRHWHDALGPPVCIRPSPPPLLPVTSESWPRYQPPKTMVPKVQFISAVLLKCQGAYKSQANLLKRKFYSGVLGWALRFFVLTSSQWCWWVCRPNFFE